MTDLSIRLCMFVTGALASVGDRIHSDERGQDLLEWVLLGGLVALAIVGIGVLFGTKLTAMANNIGNCLDFDNTTPCSPGF